MPIERLIYDAGMNNGDDTAYYLSRGFRTVAIEANPELASQAKTRFAREIASGRLIILNVGIADREGELPFWICETNHRSSSFDRNYASWGNSPNHQIQVPCTRFETKCISQSTFIPLQLPPASEQHRLQRAETLLGSPKFRHRVFRKLGGRSWLQRQLRARVVP